MMQILLERAEIYSTVSWLTHAIYCTFIQFCFYLDSQQITTDYYCHTGMNENKVDAKHS